MLENTRTNSQVPLTLIALADLHPCPFNRPERSGFDEKSIAELAQSILTQGIIEPLIVRKNPRGKGFEIVAGERRWTAAKVAKLSTAPCIERDLDDNAARKIQIIENLQREGLHPVEEAKGYADLLAQKDAKGQPVNTIESIAKEIGKSAAFVYGRLKLLKMPKVALEASFIDKLSASNALFIARIPDPKLAYKASLEVLDPYGTGDGPEREKRALDPEIEPMSYRKAKEHIQTNYMVRLKGAPFDQEDAELVPAELVDGERRCGGKCSDCPLRTGNMRASSPTWGLRRLHQYHLLQAQEGCRLEAGQREGQSPGPHPVARRQGQPVVPRRRPQLTNHEFRGRAGHLPRREEEDLGTGPGRGTARQPRAGPRRQTQDPLPHPGGQGQGSRQEGWPHPAQGIRATMAMAIIAPIPRKRSARKPTRSKTVQRGQAIAAAARRPGHGQSRAAPTLNWWRWILSSLIEGNEHQWAERFGCQSVKALGELIDNASEAKCRAMLVAVYARPHDRLARRVHRRPAGCLRLLQDRPQEDRRRQDGGIQGRRESRGGQGQNPRRRKARGRIRFTS